MDPIGESDVPPQRPRFTSGPPEVGVHVLGQHEFCPQAALLTLESGEDEGEEEPTLGPRLDGYADYRRSASSMNCTRLGENSSAG